MSSHSLPARTGALALVAALIVSLAAPAAQAQDQGRINLFGQRSSVIIGVAAAVPTDRATRAAYGDVTFSPSLSLWAFDGPPGVGLSVDLGGGRMAGDASRAYLIHGGLGPRVRFTSADADVAPYLTVRGDAYVVRMDPGAWTTKPGANVEIGAAILRHLVISGRYDYVPKVSGVDFSGLSTRIAVKVF